MTIAQDLNVMITETPRTPEQNLWKSVILQAIHDAFSKNKFLRWRAWAWFYYGSHDYCKVCDMAGISADRLRQTMIETVLFNNLIQKGDFTMEDLITKKAKTVTQKFDLARRAKAIFRAIYNQQELDKAIGSLTLQDILNICKQSELEIDAELEDDNE
jgi:hypothetical protein